jgi:polysaccharide deacetylase family protein (PEP-CTERM system associated)
MIGAERRRTEGILTVDYEDWFHVADPAYTDPACWDELPIHVGEDTLRLLELLDEYEAHATFFVVGWLAERTPEVLREITRRGHRLALHGVHHVPPNKMSEDEFREDILHAKRILGSVAGVVPHGYRAPYFGVHDCSFSHFEVLRSCGLTYDSSIFPGVFPGRGRPGIPLRPYQTDTAEGVFWEVPVSAIRLLGVPLAFSGGGFLRLLPGWFVSQCCSAVVRSGTPVVFYMHPRDLNPRGAVVPAPALKRAQYYAGRRSLRTKLTAALRRMRLMSIEEYLSIADDRRV